MHQPGRATVQEIGHFAAHRHDRDKGISLTRANDILTSARLWHQQFNLTNLTTDHLKEAVLANFRIIPDDLIKKWFVFSLQQAKHSFNKLITKIGERNSLLQVKLVYVLVDF